MASPIAASAAATVRTNIAKTWPARSLRLTEKATKLMLTAKSISSIDIRMMMTFLRLRKMPKTPRVKRIAATVRYCARPTAINSLSGLWRAGAERHLDDRDRLPARPRQLRGDALAAHPDPRSQGQD